MSRNGDYGWDMDMDTDEIRSIDSDQLHDIRPNRWTGLPQTWLDLTAVDRRGYAAFEKSRNRDLSLHLYNAFALKTRDVLTRSGILPDDIIKDAAENDWTPGKSWTAWPMRPDVLPPDDFMTTGEFQDDEGGRTWHRPSSRQFPGAELEDELSATILRLAKERFRERDAEEQDQQVLESIEDVDTLSAHVKGQSVVDTEDEEGLQTSMKESDASAEVRAEGERPRSPEFVPTVSADDELSYELLQPTTRHVLTKLDKTLTILHNARVRAVDSLGHASQDEEEEEEAEIEKSTTLRRPTTNIWDRYRKEVEKDVRKELQEAAAARTPPTPRRRGRQKKVNVPLEGETERQMLVRLARQNHKPIPKFSDDEKEPSPPPEEPVLLKRKRRKEERGERHETRPQSREDDSDKDRRKRIGLLALRDWRDVLGAAAMAGFQQKVIARAAHRCADLFGQGMEFHTLAEEPAEDGGVTSRTLRIVPGQPTPSVTDEEEEDDGGMSDIERLRTISRGSSIKVGSSSSDEEDRDTKSGKTTKKPRRQQSVGSGVTSAGRLYCPDPRCSRAVHGFPRRSNLIRHLETMHGKSAAALSEDEDEMDEVHGAVHVDGFLKPIKARAGWRAADNTQRVRRKDRRRRGRRSSDDDRETGDDGGFNAENEEYI